MHHSAGFHINMTRDEEIDHAMDSSGVLHFDTTVREQWFQTSRVTPAVQSFTMPRVMKETPIRSHMFLEQESEREREE